MKPISLPLLDAREAAGQNALVQALHGAAWQKKITIHCIGDKTPSHVFPFLLALGFSGRRFLLGLNALPFADDLARLSTPLTPLQLPPLVLEAMLAGLAGEEWGEEALADFSFEMLEMDASPPDSYLQQTLRLTIETQPVMELVLLAEPDFPFAALARKLTRPAKGSLWPPQLLFGLPLLAGRLVLARDLWRGLAPGDILFPDRACAPSQIVTRPNG